MTMAGSGSFQNRRIASKHVMMLVALLLVSCCLGHGIGDEDRVEVEGIIGGWLHGEREKSSPRHQIRYVRSRRVVGSLLG
ncbi:hypothetical protein BHE74_00032731 [Ensete ventricosum]|nr:hypothetical protein BHE74_00032731 [Ensete ventricosum]